MWILTLKLVCIVHTALKLIYDVKENITDIKERIFYNNGENLHCMKY